MSLLVATIPLAGIAAAPGDSNNFVVVAHPRGATATDGGVLVNALDGLYIFDVDLFDAAGHAKPVKTYQVELNTIDGTQNNGPAHRVFDTGDVDNAAAVSHFVIRVPEADMIFSGAAMGGVSLTVTEVRDAAGVHQCPLDQPASNCPSGNFNVGANEAAAQGKWAQADSADSAFTPIFLVSDQPAGLVSVGNAILNGGFEAGTPAQDGVADSDIAPWFPAAFNAACASGCSHFGEVPTPASTVALGVGEGKSSGAALKVIWSNADAGRNAVVGQLLGVPGQVGVNNGAWFGGSDVVVTLDAKVAGPNSPSYTPLVSLHGTGSNGADFLVTRFTSTLSPSNGWTHFSFDFGNAFSGKPLTALYLPLDSSITGDDGTLVYVDNVVLSGATLQDHASRNDLADGYTVVIKPYSIGVSDGQAVSQDLVQTAQGTFYAYEVSALSYLGGSAHAVPIGNGADDFWFELVGQSDAAGSRHDASSATFWTNNAGRVFSIPTSDGPSNKVLVLADGALTGPVVPWTFVNVPTDGVYTDTFGNQAQPTSGYYSPARNNLAPFSIADQMDYAFTPVRLTGNVGEDLSVVPTLELTCPGASSTAMCKAEENPVMHVAYKAAAKFTEPVTLTLSTASGTTLATATITSTSSGADMTITKAQMDAMALAGDMRVVATSSAGTFVTDATSNVYRLDNFLPTASYTQSVTSGITRLTNIAFVSTSTDSDGTIAQTRWVINSPTNAGVAQGSSTRLTMMPHQLGAYTGTLTVTDDAGGSKSAAIAFNVVDIAPVAAFTAPTAVKAGQPFTLTDKSSDADGRVVAYEINSGSGFAPATLPLTTTLSASGPVSLRVQDDNGVWSAPATVNVVADALAPVTHVTYAAVPSSGWYTSAVQLNVARSDDVTGVKSTTVSIDGIDTVLDGAAPATINVTGDGVHTITATSVDNVGNVENVQTFTIAIDTTAADSKLLSPQFVGPFGGAFATGDRVSVSAQAIDATSGVTQVAVKLDAGCDVGSPGCIDDGWFEMDLQSQGHGVVLGSYTYVIPPGLQQGTHEIQVRATNAAGIISAPKTTTILVI